MEASVFKGVEAARRRVVYLEWHEGWGGSCTAAGLQSPRDRSWKEDTHHWLPTDPWAPHPTQPAFAEQALHPPHASTSERISGDQAQRLSSVKGCCLPATMPRLWIVLHTRWARLSSPPRPILLPKDMHPPSESRSKPGCVACGQVLTSPWLQPPLHQPQLQ